MKAVIDGIEVECTVEEFLQLKGTQAPKEKPQPAEKKVVVVKQVVREPIQTKNDDSQHYKPWTDRENGILRLFYEQNFANVKLRKNALEQLTKLLPGRTEQAISSQASSIGLIEELGKKKTAESNEPTVARGMSKKPIAQILKHHYGPNDQQKVAMAKAASGDFGKVEQKPVKTVQEVARDPEKPKMPGLPDNLNDIFATMVQHIIANHGKLNYFEMQGAIGIETPFFWKKFCTDFALRAHEYASYFGVPNKFRLHTEGARVFIAYG